MCSQNSHFLHLSCSTPLFSLTTEGTLVNKGKSWLLPGATEADLKVSFYSRLTSKFFFQVDSVKIIAHHEMAATKLQKQEIINLIVQVFTELSFSLSSSNIIIMSQQAIKEGEGNCGHLEKEEWKVKKKILFECKLIKSLSKLCDLSLRLSDEQLNRSFYYCSLWDIAKVD